MKFEEHKKGTRFRLYFILFVFVIYILGLLYDFFIHGSEKISYLNYLVLSLMLCYIYLFLIKGNESKKIVPFFVFFLGCYYILFIPLFSPIDEGAHFDYILHIVQNHKLPLLSDVINTRGLYKVTGNLVPSNYQYEAVHPPLYYLISAVIVFVFQKNLLLSVIMLRAFGIFLILVVFYFGNKTYEELVRKNIIQRNDLLFRSVALAFFLNPGFVTRMISISNEQLIVCIMTILIYSIVKIVGSPPSFKQIFFLSLLSAAMILTKFTSIFVLGVIVLLCLFYKQIIKAILYVSITLLITLPWFIFNYTHYNKLTATKLHVDFVKGIVNPENIQLTPYYILQKISYLFGSFWNPQESGFPGIKEPFYTITTLMSGVILLVILAMIIYFIKNLKSLKNIQLQVIILILTSVILNIMVICYGTISEDVDIIIGRYLYMNALSMVILTVILIQKVIVLKHQRIVGVVIMIMSCCLTSNFMLDTAQSGQNLANKIKYHFLNETISIKNYSDDRYKSSLDVQALINIPLRLGETNFENSSNLDLIQKDNLEMNSLKLISDYEFQIVGNDPFLVLDVKHLVQSNDLIKLKITNIYDDGTGQLFWNSGQGFSEENSVTFNIVNGANTYLIPIGKNTKWMNGKNIKELRLDFDLFKMKDTIKISDFEFIYAN
ncbi:hypothetical protein NYE24_16685 [Paenibacillus sp. FSL H7-0350]|uniref:ArnT family glycosyltransferase n=1 Tax=Paenibacillus sp. FSL H7-0350 TaxID=2975345 RepID=UPI003158E724